MQQGPKLVGSGAVGIGASQGFSVALSADGNTAIVGGFADEWQGSICCYPPAGIGAAWIWTRSGGVWRQQGPKLVASGSVSNYSGVGQGYSVALSADGNTALVGAHGDPGAWVWTRSGGVWRQQGAKLPGNGDSVALSADGNHALLGGGSVWTRENGVWKAGGQLGTKGFYVALSGDGNTAIMGGPYDDNRAGAVYVWARSAGVWTSRSKLVTSDRAGLAQQGWSVAISADGSTILAGGPYDDSSTGAAWVFAGMPDAPPPPARQHAVRR